MFFAERFFRAAGKQSEEPFLFGWTRVCAAFLVLIAPGVTAAAAPVQVDAMEYPCEAQPAVAVSKWGAGQALPGICGCGLRLIPSQCVGLTEAFAMLMFVLSDFCPPCWLSSPGIETKLQPRRAKEKADFRCALQSLIVHYNYAPSVRGLSPPAIDSRMEVSACTFFMRT